jgi:hypothetical protein
MIIKLPKIDLPNVKEYTIRNGHTFAYIMEISPQLKKDNNLEDKMTILKTLHEWLETEKYERVRVFVYDENNEIKSSFDNFLAKNLELLIPKYEDYIVFGENIDYQQNPRGVYVSNTILKIRA